MRLIDTVLFDWDGTLLDSSPLAFLAFQKTFIELGIAFDHEAYERTYSPNWYEMYQAFELPAHRWPEADDLWIKHYGQQTAELVEGARDALGTLSARGYILGIVTSGSRERVRRELRALELSELFRTVVCNEDVFDKKPHPEGLHRAMRCVNRSPQNCCYVGDSPVDVEMGRRAGVQTIGIIGGYPSSKALRGTNPDYCFDSIAQLLPHFGKNVQAAGNRRQNFRKHPTTATGRNRKSKCGE